MKKEYFKPELKAVKIQTGVLLSMSFGQNGNADSGNASLNSESVSDDTGDYWSGAW